MSIIMARLQPRDFRKGWKTKDYTSTRHHTYRAGEDGVPSPLVRVEDPAELAELREFSTQFEFIEVHDEAELAELLQYEMEVRVRAGGAPIRAEVLGVDVPAPAAPIPPRRRIEDLAPRPATPAPTSKASAAASGAPNGPQAEFARRIPMPKEQEDADGDTTFVPQPLPKAPAGAPDEGGADPGAGSRGGRGGRRARS